MDISYRAIFHIDCETIPEENHDEFKKAVKKLDCFDEFDCDGENYNLVFDIYGDDEREEAIEDVEKILDKFGKK